MFEIETKIIKPIFAALAAQGIEYKGVLYPGIMITSQGPKVIEINARFGDPECEAYMLMLQNDLLDLLDDCVDGGIGTHSLRWAPASAAGVVLVSGGYPDAYATGKVIKGVQQAASEQGVVVFHANTSKTESLQTNGGRVFCVAALGSPLRRAVDLAYAAADTIQFEGKYMRRDIGHKELF